MHIKHIIIFLLVLARVVAQPIPVGAASFGEFKVTNSSNAPIGVYIVARDSDGVEVPGSNVSPVTIAGGGNFTFLYSFPEGGTVARFDAYRNMPPVVVQGASLISTTGLGPQLLFRTFNSGQSAVSGPPYFSSFTLVDAEVLSEGEKTVWKLSDSSLTSDLYREGVDKIVHATAKGGGSSAAAAGLGESVASLILETVANRISPATVLSAVNAAQTAAGASVEDNMVRNPNLPGLTGSGGTGAASADFWVLNFPRGGGLEPYHINVNPLDVSGVSEIAVWVRLLITLIILYHFESWAWGQFEYMIRQAAFLPQARGNQVAGTGGQGFAFLAAGLICVVLTSFPALFFAGVTTATAAFAIVTGSLGTGDVMPSGGSNFMVQGFWLVNQFFPTTLLFLVISQMFVIRKLGTKIFMVAAVAVRYITP